MQTTGAVAAPLETKNNTLQDCPKDKKKETFLALTGMRAMAAYFVCFHHFPIESLIFPGFDIQQEMHIGVSIFFVLSGFLICYRYFDNVNWDGAWFKQYFQNRFARIYPVYFILCVCGILAGKYYGTKNVVLNLTLTHAFFPDVKRVLMQSWTLTVEECFYVSAPFIFFTGRKKLIYPYLFFWALFPIALRINNWLPSDSSFLKGYGWVTLYTFFGRFTEFFVGIALCKMMLAGKLKSNRKYLFTFIGMTGIFGVMAAMALIQQPTSELETIPAMILNNFILPFFVASLIYGLVREKTWLGNLFSTSFAVLLGKSSYAFYLVHLSVVTLFIPAAAEAIGMPRVLVGFVIYNIVSIVIYKYIEHPLNNLIRKL